MSRLSWILALWAALLRPEWLHAKTPPETETVQEDTLVARIVGRLPIKARQQLRRALPLAVKGLRENWACRELFAKLGAEGRERLAATIYTGTISFKESQICQKQNAAAFTTVGGRRTIICSPAFGRLPGRRAAVILLHEALHHAGLSESPVDPGAPSPREIDRMVEAACGL